MTTTATTDAELEELGLRLEAEATAAEDDEDDEDEEDEEATPTCECGCGCDEPATHEDEGGWVCDECADYYCDEGGQPVCARVQDRETCHYCDGPIEWDRIQTGRCPGMPSTIEGRCGCRRWRQTERGSVWELAECGEFAEDAASCRHCGREIFWGLIQTGRAPGMPSFIKGLCGCRGWRQTERGSVWELAECGEFGELAEDDEDGDE